jgi:hypothetical protein
MELQRGMQRPFRLRKAYGATGRLGDGHRFLVTGTRDAAPVTINARSAAIVGTSAFRLLTTDYQSLLTSNFSLSPHRVSVTSTFLASPAATSISVEPFSLFASQVTRYLPAGKYKCGSTS